MDRSLTRLIEGKVSKKIELKYDTVKVARYEVRKFWTYRTVEPS